ncbi:MAG: C-GCAxxG-C-C family (seleno)protein, partial [Paraclostridium sp.]
MNKEISIKKVKFDAEEAYRVGDFFCSEAIVNSIRNNIAPEMPEALIAVASGFPVGIGKSKCVCGAV